MLLTVAAGQTFLPDGWRKVESKSRPGEFVYENVHTEERVAWFPTQPASKTGIDYAIHIVAINLDSHTAASARACQAARKGKGSIMPTVFC